MIVYSIGLAAVAALLFGALAVRATTRNRHVRRRQRLTILLALAWMMVEAVLAWRPIDSTLEQQVRSLAHVGLALAWINFIVVALANPLRIDRAPERFPVILQDTVIVVLFAVAATAILRERVLAVSAVGAVVLGFALQDTLGNAFAGLAIQTEKPFEVGHWIHVADREGQVTEITWRATKLRTKDNSFLVVPNNVMSREVVLNYSEPVLPTRIWVEVGAGYQHPPNVVKAAMLEAVVNAPLVLAEPRPEVLLMEFASSSIVYRARFWIEDYARDEVARDQVRSGIWYSFKRHGIEIPWPIRIEYHREEPPAVLPDRLAAAERTFARVEVFGGLQDAERRQLAEVARERLFATGEVIVRQDAPGHSMFVVESGEVEVVLEPGAQRLATIGPAGFFGEMSLLAGAPRSATVRALCDATLLELGVDAFRRFVLERPDVLGIITRAAMERRQALERTREDAAIAVATRESAGTFLATVRRFLRLT